MDLGALDELYSVTRQVAVYHVSVTRQFIQVLGILEMRYLWRFISSFRDLRDGISQEIQLRLTHVLDQQ